MWPLVLASIWLICSGVIAIHHDGGGGHGQVGVVPDRVPARLRRRPGRTAAAATAGNAAAGAAGRTPVAGSVSVPRRRDRGRREVLGGRHDTPRAHGSEVPGRYSRNDRRECGICLWRAASIRSLMAKSGESSADGRVGCQTLPGAPRARGAAGCRRRGQARTAAVRPQPRSAGDVMGTLDSAGMLRGTTRRFTLAASAAIVGLVVAMPHEEAGAARTVGGPARAVLAAAPSVVGTDQRHVPSSARLGGCRRPRTSTGVRHVRLERRRRRDQRLEREGGADLSPCRELSSELSRSTHHGGCWAASSPTTVSAINVDTHAVVTTIAVGSTPNWLAVDPIRHTVWVTVELPPRPQSQSSTRRPPSSSAPSPSDRRRRGRDRHGAAAGMGRCQRHECRHGNQREEPGRFWCRPVAGLSAGLAVDTNRHLVYVARSGGVVAMINKSHAAVTATVPTSSALRDRRRFQPAHRLRQQ